MSVKKEIKINKRKLKKNILTCIFSLLIAFVILFSISLFGEVHGTVYEGILADEYEGDGIIDFSWDYNSPTGKYSVGGIPADPVCTVKGNFILGTEKTSELNFKQKLFVFYLPLVIFEKFWLWMFLAAIILLLFRLTQYLKDTYSIKFE